MSASQRRPTAQRGARLPVPALLVAAGVVLAAGVATRVLAAAAERKYPPSGRTIEVRGLAQHVLDRGSGAPIVLVHGAFGGLQDFAATVLEPLAERHRCIAWDRPGHGYSERPDGETGPGEQARLLLELLAALEVEDPLLVGFSYGGAVVLAAALAAPERVRGVVLVNGPSHPWPEPVELHYRLAGVPLLGRLLTETLVAPFGTLASNTSVEQAFLPQPVPASFAASPIALALRPASYRANAEDVRLLSPFLATLVARYADLAVPVTMVVGDGDRVVGPRYHAPRLAAVAPDVTVIRVADGGHQLLYTHPDEVLAAVEEALAAAGG